MFSRPMIEATAQVLEISAHKTSEVRHVARYGHLNNVPNAINSSVSGMYFKLRTFWILLSCLSENLSKAVFVLIGIKI